MAVLQHRVLSGGLYGNSACLILSREKQFTAKNSQMAKDDFSNLFNSHLASTFLLHTLDLYSLILTVCTISVPIKLSGTSPKGH